MANLLLKYVLLFLVLRPWTSLSKREEAPCNFCLTQITTQNMETRIFWRSNFSYHDATIRYILQHNCVDDHWVSVPCPRPQWHNSSGEMSCVLLTCATTPLDEYCEIRVEAHGNSSVNFTTKSAVHNPTSENIPPRITDVKIAFNHSFPSAVISWKLPVGFCTRSKYCMEFKYHRHGAKLNKTVSVLSPNLNSTSIAGLDICSKYLFYLVVYEDELCSIPIATRWTTGPFLLLSQAIEKSSLGVRVFNFNSTIFWRQADFCSLKPTQFSVYYKSSELSGNWTRFYCKIKKESSKDFSCEFLTCAVIQDRGYDVQIRINGADGQLENSLHFVPSLENIPDQVEQVTITALTAKSLEISWKLPPSFCSKFPYCFALLVSHRDSQNETVEVKEREKDQNSTIVDNLQAYTKYYFYTVTFPPSLGCFYQTEYSRHASGPFTATTLEDVPSTPPVLICSLCDVIVDGKTRSGTVRWQLPPEDKWNGLPRIFFIQWREKSDKNFSVWNNETILKARANEGKITGLLTRVEYFVRMKMCNGERLCSKFTEELLIDILERNDTKPEETASSARTIAISVGVTLAVLIVILLGTLSLYFKHKKYNSHVESSLLPNLESLSYENISLQSTRQSYSELPSPIDECYPVASSDQPDKTSEKSSQAGDVTTISKTDIL